jgi:hypothetical protein
VEQFMGQMTERCARKLFVQLGDRFVFVGFSQLFAFVLGINRGNPFFADFIGGHTGLSSSPDTSAGTGHHFNKMIVLFVCADFFDQLTRIGQCMDNGDLGSRMREK